MADNKEYEEIEREHKKLTEKKGTQKKATKSGEQKRYRYGAGRKIRRARSA